MYIGIRNMEIRRLLEILDDWKIWMKKPDYNGLGFPDKVPILQSGGYPSNDAFEEMIDKSNNEVVKIIDTLIHYSLDLGERQAIYARYLNTKKPNLYEYKLQSAVEKLLKLSEGKIFA